MIITLDTNVIFSAIVHLLRVYLLSFILFQLQASGSEEFSWNTATVERQLSS